jgi:hypothetical protein
MNTKTILAIALVVLGIAALVYHYQSISYMTVKKTKVVDLGPLQVATEQPEVHTIPLPPILGALALVGGIVLLVTGGKGT